MMYFRSLLVCFFLILLPFVGFAQNPEAPLVRELQVVNLGAGKVDDSYVVAHIGSGIDAALDRNLIAQDIKKLLATGRFTDVLVEIEPMDDGLRLTYSVRNKFRLAQAIEVRGSKHFGEKRLREMLSLYPGDLVDMQILQVRGQNVVTEYGVDYFSDCKLKWDIIETDHDHGFARVVLDVDEGKRLKVKHVVIEGNNQVSTGDLRSIIKRRSWWDPRWLFRKKKYTSDELDMMQVTIRDYYLNAGFMDVVVNKPILSTDDRELQVQVSVVEGDQYRIGDISIDGITLFPEEDLTSLMFLKKGGIAASARMDQFQMVLRDYYGGRGYINTDVRLVLEPDSKSGVVDINYQITEGALIRIRNIKIEGNTRTKDKVIRRELLVYPGDIYNEVKVRRSRLICSNLGFFSSVRVRPLSTPLADYKDLVLDVEEKPTGNLMMGAGFSSIDKIMGFLELSQGNFDITNWRHPTGGGQKLKLRAQFGSEREIYEVSFVEPWFFDRKLSLGVDLYRTEVSSSDYEVERTGGAISLAKKLPGPNRIRFRYELEKVSSITDTNTYYFIESGEEADFIEEARVQSTLSISIIHNTCNNPFAPTKGMRASIHGSLSGGPLGFDADIYTLGVKAAQFFPLWFGHVFSLRGRCEVVDTFGNTDEVPYSERLFLGGGRTIRGFDYRDIGPKVLPEPHSSEGLYKAYGGNTLLYGSASYTVPVVPGVRVALFYDIGNVWRDVYEFSGHNLASSVGTGLRLDMPGFPIRLDRAWVLEKDHEITNEDKWAIWIGHDF